MVRIDGPLASACRDKDGFCFCFRVDAPLGREKSGRGAEDTHDCFVGG